MVQFSGCARLFARYARGLGRQLPLAVAGDVTAVHRTRVASRRLSEILPIVSGSSRRVRRKLRRVRRTFGSVRELDVLVELFDERSPECDAIAASLRSELMAAREVRCRRLRMKFGRGKATKIRRTLAALVREVSQLQRSRGWREALAIRLARRTGQFRNALEGARSLYVPDKQHAVRITAKRLRYTLECAAAAGDEAAVRLLGTLRRAQQLLGRQHDVRMLLDRVHAFQADHVGKPALGVLDRLETNLEADCRRLQARYVRLLPALKELADRASEIAAGLALQLRSSRTVKMALPLGHVMPGRRDAGRAKRSNG